MSRILLIEDEESSRLLYRSRLEDLGHEVVLAPTGAMGLMEARAHRFDLFLVDISLGSGINGFEVCQRLKAIPKTRRVPVVLISGQVRSRDELHRGYEAGCEAFLVKGEINLLEDVVRAMLRLKDLQDELTAQNTLLEQHYRRLQQVAEQRPEGAPEGSGPGVTRPDGTLVVGRDGVVAASDLGARELFGKQIVGLHLASLAPKSRLEAIVRDVESEIHEGTRFDVRYDGGWTVRRLVATVVPTVAAPTSRQEGWRLVLLYDVDRHSPGFDLGDGKLLQSELGPILEAARRMWRVSSIVGRDPRVGELRDSVHELARTSAPALVFGEEGVGKDLVAHCVHFATPWSGPLLPVRVGGLDEAQVADELFGVLEDGVQRPGAFQIARGGTVFLDGIELLPSKVQEELAEALETRTFARRGADESLPLEVRVLASASGDPRTLAERGVLSSRILGSFGQRCVHLPPLRERPDDLPLLVAHLAERHAPGQVSAFASEVLWAFLQHDWPRNVRELEEVVQAILADTDETDVRLEHLPPWLRELADGAPADLPKTMYPHARPVTVAGQPQPSAIEEEEISLPAYEKRAILRALEKSGGDRIEAAKILNIGKSTLYRKLKKHSID